MSVTKVRRVFGDSINKIIHRLVSEEVNPGKPGDTKLRVLLLHRIAGLAKKQSLHENIHGRTVFFVENKLINKRSSSTFMEVELMITKNMKRCFPTILLTTAFWSSSVFAAPTISSISGTISNGQTITIAGTGFGVKNPVAPQIWTDFSAGLKPLPLSLQTSLISQAVTITSSYPSTGYTPTNGYAVLGTNFYTGSSEIGSGPPSGASKWTKIYNYVKRYYSFNTTSNQKAWRLYNKDMSRDFMQSFEPGGRAYAENTGDIGSLGFYATPGGSWQGSRSPAGQWNIEEFRWTYGSGGADGLWEYMYNGVQSQLRTNVIMGTVSDYTTFYLSNFCATQPPSGSTVYMSDFYVDTTDARVMIGNAPTLTASTHREIQIPKTIWVDGQIQVQVNQGNFKSGEIAYLFVIDSSNVPSVGKQIVFGSGVDGGSTMPSAPKNLKVTSN